MTTVVVVGSGAREHALAEGLRRDGATVFVTPGNAGMAADGLTCVATSPLDLTADLFVIGPEQPLVEGLADQLRARGALVMGPGALGAQLEGSKVFLKHFLRDAGVPTARYDVCATLAEAQAVLDASDGPYVIKTDGLAAGKGVLVTSSRDEALADITSKLAGTAFGDAGRTVVLEDFLDGYECSVLALCDGQRVVPLVPAQDYKRVGDGDTGPNTGGMGARAPLPHFSDDDLAVVVSTILEPTVAALVARGIDFRGVLYAGIMMTSTGPILLEYNVRFGDPETQVVLPLWGEGLTETLLQCARGALVGAPSFRDDVAVTIVLASPGYPDAPRTGVPIHGLNANGQLDAVPEGVHVFHAGTTRDADGVFHTSGGRVLSVTAVAADHATARQHAYDAARRIAFEGCVMRSDIATKEIA